MNIIITLDLKSHEANAFTTKKAAADSLNTTPKTILEHIKSGKPFKHIAIIREVTVQRAQSKVRHHSFR